MPESEYKLELTSVFDPNSDVTFRVEPPVKFLTEESRKAFGENALRLIARRADYGELEGSKIELTHDSADGTATLGYARVPALRYGTGEEVFYQGLLLALNGQYPELYDAVDNTCYDKQMTNPATTNNAKSYDDHADDWHAAMETNFGHKYLEKPAITSLLPETLHGKTVLCIGVGSGEELSELLGRDPKRVVAIDISEKLLKITGSKFPQVELHKMDMMDLSFPDEAFDYVYSSLALHYANDWDELLAGVHRVLKRSGQLIFSTHNPDYWSKKPATGNYYTNPRGVRLAEHQGTLPGGVEITYYNHESKAKINEAVEHAGFTVKTSFEPKVEEADTEQLSESQANDYNALKLKNGDLPLFYVVSAIKE